MRLNRVLLAISLGMVSFVDGTLPSYAYSVTRQGCECKASWYGPGLHGNTMANGQRFNKNDVSVVASREYPFGTVLDVVDQRTRKVIRVTVKDDGPHIRGRCLDLSEGAATKLGFKESGVTNVTCKVVHWPEGGKFRRSPTN